MKIVRVADGTVIEASAQEMGYDIILISLSFTITDEAERAKIWLIDKHKASHSLTEGSWEMKVLIRGDEQAQQLRGALRCEGASVFRMVYSASHGGFYCITMGWISLSQIISCLRI